MSSYTDRSPIAEKACLKSIAEDCRNILEELQKTLNKHCEFGSIPQSVGEKEKKEWKGLESEVGNISRLQRRINENIDRLNIFQGSIAR
jgi:hypothetical protein